MRPARFSYVRAASRTEALEALARYGDAAVLLAGGQSLVPMMNMRIARPGVVVDINRCADLAGLREEAGDVVAGAMLRQARAEREPLLRSRCPLLIAALPWVGHISNRTRGTLGGSFAQADPAAELPGVAVALDAVFVIDGPDGTREAAASADLTRLRHTAHYLKNSADVMHYSALSRRCRDLEAAVFPGGVAAKSADYGAATQRVIAELDQVAPPTL